MRTEITETDKETIPFFWRGRIPVINGVSHEKKNEFFWDLGTVLVRTEITETDKETIPFFWRGRIPVINGVSHEKKNEFFWDLGTCYES